MAPHSLLYPTPESPFIHSHRYRILHSHTHTHIASYINTHTHTTHHLCLCVFSLDLNSFNLFCLLLYQTPVTSHWIQTQHSDTSICLRGTGGWRLELISR